MPYKDPSKQRAWKRAANKKYRENNPDYFKEWRKANPGYYTRYYLDPDKQAKRAIRMLVRANVIAGNITKPEVCSNCSKKTRVEAHHEDYSKPLNVIWLCIDCHKAEHILP